MNDLGVEYGREYSDDGNVIGDAGGPSGRRSLKLTSASSIVIRPVRWLWQDRLPLGAFTLLGGREGIGKSTGAYTLVADITRGRLLGEHFGTPKAVIVAATEDSWAHTIVPRLMAADADLGLVYRVEAVTIDGVAVDAAPELPRDLDALERAIKEVGAVFVLLDPLMSRLSAKLDTHKDQHVRQALEPLAKLADGAGVTVLGIIHVSKATSSDPLTLLMGSRAFAAVARAALFVVKDPENDGVRFLGQPKNNLGRIDLPTLTFRIESAHVADTDEGPVWTSRLVWTGEVERTIQDVLDTTSDGTDMRTAVGEAALWLTDYLTSQGGTDESSAIKAAGRKADHSPDALKRARSRLRIMATTSGFPRRSFWTLPGAAALTTPNTPTALTAPTALAEGNDQLVQWVQSGEPPREIAPTETVCRSCGFPIDQALGAVTIHPTCGAA